MAENVPNQVGEAFVAVKADASGVAAGMADAAKKVEDGGKRVEDAAKKVGEDAGKKMGEAIAEEAGKVTGRAVAPPAGGGGVPPGGFNPGRGYVPPSGGGGGSSPVTAGDFSAAGKSAFGLGGVVAAVSNIINIVERFDATVKRLEEGATGLLTKFTALGVAADAAVPEVDSTNPRGEIARIEAELEKLAPDIAGGEAALAAGFLTVAFEKATEQVKQFQLQLEPLRARLAAIATVQEQIFRDQQRQSSDQALGSIAFDSRRIGAALTELGSRQPR